MAVPYPIATLSLLFLLLAFRILLSRRRYGKLPPSPPAIPIIGHLHLLKSPLYKTFQTLSHKYSPILSLRFGSQLVVVVSSPSAVEECFTKNDVVLANRPRFASGKHLGFNYTTMVTAPYGEHWRNLRRLSALEIFSANRLNMFLGIRRDEINCLVRGLAQDSREGFGKVELRPLLSELTFNIITRMIVGKRYYGKEAEFEEAERFRKIIYEIFRLGGASNPVDYYPILRWIGYADPEKKMEKIMRETGVILHHLIDEHRDGNDRALADDNTMIGHLLKLQKSDPEYYTDDIINGLVMVLILAGTDTSAATLEWAMALLLNHPDVLKKAKAELETQVGKDHLIEEQDLPKLHYLQNICCSGRGEEEDDPHSL